MSGDYDKVEKLLKRSEKYGPSEAKHANLRRKIMRETYRKQISNGDTAGALDSFRKYQAEQADEDERIWMGEQLAKRAWAAYQSKDKLGLKEAIRQAEEVAPMNTELRQLKAKLEGEDSVFTNVLMFGGGAIVLVLGATQLSKWRSKARVKGLSSNKFEDALDEEA